MAESGRLVRLMLDFRSLSRGFSGGGFLTGSGAKNLFHADLFRALVAEVGRHGCAGANVCSALVRLFGRGSFSLVSFDASGEICSLLVIQQLRAFDH